MEYRKGGIKVTADVEVAKEQLKEQQNIDKIPPFSSYPTQFFYTNVYISMEK